ncbi:RluA family pseudouridine synthase [Poritiphilus flavus]|uniref:RNA pseudouridine synthase n=1 Tax=Poritiphilus flavus TaxID=2697053 RepID=A0A6L9EF96_9FLAO|nr:RNA pseudouridine synthase [Poritiphilus flavus]NAS13434.1 RNA pseudouridine synthase [Poritiphilus flavus]
MRSNPSNLEVLYEDNHLIAINKRSGDIVQGDKTGDIPLSEIVKRFLKAKYKKEGNVYLGVVHRLDRPTTGAVIFSKTSKALPRLNKMFVAKTVTKTYWALVQNKPEAENGKLIHWLKRNPRQNKSYAYPKEVPDSKQAILNYSLRQKLDNYYLLEIQLETGRHHQIRCQLAAIGSPIRGDLKYGAPRSNRDGSISLHSRSISFVHPVKKTPLQIVAPPPADPIWASCI